MRRSVLSAARRLVVDSANLPLYYLSRAIPKSRRLWLFGAWFGERYSDNARALFEHVLSQEPDIKPVWLTTSRAVRSELRQRGLPVVHPYSIRGYWLSMRAAAGFLCVDREDLNRFILPPTLINLWHGVALKKIMYDYDHSDHTTLLQSIIRGAFPFETPKLPGHLIVCSEGERERMASAFRLPTEHVHVTGYPRDDALLTGTARGNESDLMRILYLPTHRKTGQEALLRLLEDSMNEIDRRLVELDAVLHVKMHFYHADAPLPHSARVVPITEQTQDVTELLSDTDILITDYSSAMIDFLLMNRAIVLAPFDLQEYVTQDRELYYSYRDIAPGPVCSTWPEVLDACAAIKADPKICRERSARAAAYFHRFFDGRSSERVVALTREVVS